MTQLTPTEALLDQLLQLERFDQIPRTGYLQRGVDPAESVAEHSWHVATLAWTLFPYVQPIDELRALELALLHDVGELVVGDIPKPGAALLPAGAKRSAEDQALRAILAASGARAETLADELDQRVTREARYVHACDELQLLVKTLLYARWNRGESVGFLAQLFDRYDERQSSWSQDFEALSQLRQAIRQRARQEGLL